MSKKCPGVGRERFVSLVRILEVDDIEVIAEALAHNRDRIGRRPRPVRNVEDRLLFYPLRAQETHVPEHESPPVMADEYRSFQLQCIEKTGHIANEFVDVIVADIRGCTRLAVAALIRCNSAKARFGQCGQLKSPGEREFREAM
jgi:hypothetical protein